MKKYWLILIGIVLIVGVVGGKIYMDSKSLQTDMLEVVKSEEAKEVFEEGLKSLDPKALTKEGVIQTYEIDYESVEHNPMGGINGVLIVNKDRNLYIRFHLNKLENNKFDSAVVSGNSKMLGEKLRGENSNE